MSQTNDPNVAPAVSAVGPQLGRLQDVPVRDIWSNEASDFTPWLLDNADRLGEALGIDLEITAAEHPVGGFSLDLHGHDRTNDCVLIVENQLERTDHGHLGQILTYAAGTDARTIVWIAPDFRDEHRQALDWLNEHTDEDTHFFGVQLRVVRIGSSPPAPLFELVANPNDWQRRTRTAVAAAGATTERQQLYLAFWAKYLDRVREVHTDWTAARSPSRWHWMDQPGLLGSARYSLSFGQGGTLRNALYIDLRDADLNRTLLGILEDNREAIEATYGRSLAFEAPDGRRACTVIDSTDGDVANVDRHDAYIDWLIDSGERMRKALTPYKEAFVAAAANQ